MVWRAQLSDLDVIVNYLLRRWYMKKWIMHWSQAITTNVIYVAADTKYYIVWVSSSLLDDAAQRALVWCGIDFIWILWYCVCVDWRAASRARFTSRRSRCQRLSHPRPDYWIASATRKKTDTNPLHAALCYDEDGVSRGCILFLSFIVPVFFQAKVALTPVSQAHSVSSRRYQRWRSGFIENQRRLRDLQNASFVFGYPSYKLLATWFTRIIPRLHVTLAISARDSLRPSEQNSETPTETHSPWFYTSPCRRTRSRPRPCNSRSCNPQVSGDPRTGRAWTTVSPWLASSRNRSACVADSKTRPGYSCRRRCSCAWCRRIAPRREASNADTNVTEGKEFVGREVRSFSSIWQFPRQHCTPQYL